MARPVSGATVIARPRVEDPGPVAGEQPLDQAGEDRRALRDRGHDDVLVVAVRPTADGAEAVEGRDPEPGREVAVRGTADADPHERVEPESGRDLVGEVEQALGQVRLQRRPVRAAEDLEAGTVEHGGEGPHRPVDTVLLRGRAHPDVDRELAERRDGVLRAPRGQHRRGDARALPRVGERGQRQHLVGELDGGVDPEVRLQAGVRGPAGDPQRVERRALAARLDRPAVGGRLEDEDGRAVRGLLLDERARGRRADLLVAGDEDRDAVEVGALGPQRRERREGLDHPGEHVEAARSARDAVDHRPRQPLERADRPHRVLVAEQQHPPRARPEPPAQVGAAVDVEHLGPGAEGDLALGGDEGGPGPDGVPVRRRGLEPHEGLEVGQQVREGRREPVEPVARSGRSSRRHGCLGLARTP